jgi:hypothetical protein
MASPLEGALVGANAVSEPIKSANSVLKIDFSL